MLHTSWEEIKTKNISSSEAQATEKEAVSSDHIKQAIN